MRFGEVIDTLHKPPSHRNRGFRIATWSISLMHDVDAPEPTLEQEKLHKLANLDYNQLLSRAESLPHSRYKSLFRTNLENAMMWLDKAIHTPPPFDPTLSEEDTDG